MPIRYLKRRMQEPSGDLVNIKRAVFRIRTARIISQFIFFLLFNAVLFGFQPLPVLLPVLESMGTPQKTVGDAFAALQYMIWEFTFPWLPLASFFLVAVFLGRVTCGWACPFGFIQEILALVKRKHSEMSPRTHEDMINVKYAILGIVLLISIIISGTAAVGVGRTYRTALGVFAQAPFNTFSPHDTLFAVLPIGIYNALSAQAVPDILGALAAIPVLFWARLVILALVLVFAVYTPRSWCRYFCPTGAMLAVLNRFSFLGLKRDVVHCTKETCRECVRVCPTRVPILDLPWEKFTHPECIYCLECVEACSTRAIRPKFP